MSAARLAARIRVIRGSFLLGTLGSLAGFILASGLALAAEPPAASTDCRSEQGWDLSCIRQAYQGPSSDWPRPQIDADVAWQELAPVPPASLDPNSDAVAALGQRLFFEPQLSRGKQVSCASCHQPERSFSDGRPLAIGEDGLMGRRRSMPLYGAPFAPRLFWDGRAATLAQQVLMPISDPREMNHTVEGAIARLRTLPGYTELFIKAFGPTANSPINAERLSQALATYISTLRPPATRFDAFLAGDHKALSDREMLGLHLFRTQARCLNCHHGPLLSDQRFHDIGLSFIGRRNQDLGRYEITRDPADLGAFRTPSLRGVTQAGPWMHNGLFPNLPGLLRLYNAGMGTAQTPAGSALTPRKSPLIRPLGLTADEIDALLTFLGTR